MQGEVVQGAIDRVLLFSLRVLVTGDDFELYTLHRCQRCVKDRDWKSYQSIDVGHPHEHTTLSGVLPYHLAVEVPAHKVQQDILAS